MKKFLGPVIFGLLIFSLEVSSQQTFQHISLQAAQPSPCSDCTTCTAANICIQCNPGFLVDQPGQCSPCSANCDSCIDSNTCLECSNEYTMNSNNACLYNLVCPTNCLMCSSNTTCAICQSGFYLALDWSCQACPISCAACSNPANCTDCADGYILTGINTCQPAQISHVWNVLRTFSWILHPLLVLLVLKTAQFAPMPVHVPFAYQISPLEMTVYARLRLFALQTVYLALMKTLAQLVALPSILMALPTPALLVLRIV